MKLSVVVPIYNVAPYLRRCIDSLLKQDLASFDFEIILVDDGSTDGCAAIADEYAAQNANVVVVHQPNGGLSAARNTGIGMVRGEFVLFVDSDDFLEPNVLGSLAEKMAADRLDVLRFNYQNVDENYRIFQPYKDRKPFTDYSDEVCDGFTFLTERLGYACYAWQFVMRTELVKKSLFTEGIYFEDTDWTPRMLTLAQRVTSVDTVVYNYLMRRGSITQSINREKQRKVLTDKLLLLRSLQKQMSDKSDKRWYFGMMAATSVSLLGMIASDFWTERNHFLKEYDELHIRPLSTFHSTPRVRRKIFLINLSPRLFCWLIHLRSKK